VRVEPGAVVGAGAEIGSGTLIAAGAVIAVGVAIGRDCHVGPKASIQFALIGNSVVIRPGVSIGHEGLGFAKDDAGHAKAAHIGRVIIQDGVEIGANTTIARGNDRDTVIGEGTKIGAQAAIGADVEIGRHCLLAAQAGIAGPARLGDFVVVGRLSSVSGQVQIGDGAQIAAASAVHCDVPPGARWG
jgi:UDP-3-O-[3-hydroxymyristoyl] glucosamine N-acyltransferase